MIYAGGATEGAWEQTEADLSGVGGTQEKPAGSDAQEQRIRRVSNQRALFNLWGQTSTAHANASVCPFSYYMSAFAIAQG